LEIVSEQTDDVTSEKFTDLGQARRPLLWLAGGVMDRGDHLQELGLVHHFPYPAGRH